MARKRTRKTELAWELLDDAVRDVANQRTPWDPIDLSPVKEPVDEHRPDA